MQGLTPDMIEAGYEFLRSTLPFRRWDLPHPDRIRFRVMVTTDRYGHWKGDVEGDTVGELAISQNMPDARTCLLIQTIAHEMVHMRQEALRMRDLHGRGFKSLAKTVCLRHGWDINEF